MEENKKVRIDEIDIEGKMKKGQVLLDWRRVGSNEKGEQFALVLSESLWKSGLYIDLRYFKKTKWFCGFIKNGIRIRREHFKRALSMMMSVTGAE